MDITELQEAFDKLVYSLVRRITDGGYFPLGDYIEAVVRHGGVDVAEQLVLGEVAEPLLHCLVRNHRADLAVQRYVASVPWTILYAERWKTVEKAVSQLTGKEIAFPDRDPKDVNRALKLVVATLTGESTVENFVALAQAMPANDRGLLCSCLRATECPTYGECDLESLQRQRLAEAAAKTPEDLLQDLAQDLTYDVPLTVTPAYRAALRDHPQLRLRFETVVEQIREYDAVSQRALVDVLPELRKALDFSQTRIDRALEVWRERCEHAIVEDDGEQEGPQTERQMTTLDMLRSLHLSALHMACSVGKYMAAYAKSFGFDQAFAQHILRGDHGWAELSPLSQNITVADAVLLQFCEHVFTLVYSIYSVYYDNDIPLPVFNDGIIRSVDPIYETTNALVVEDEWFNYPVPANVLTIAMRGAYVIRDPDVQINELYFPDPYLSIDGLLQRSEEANRRLHALFVQIDVAERNATEAAVRRRMGERLFAGLCPEAATAVLGAEWVLQRPDNPDPTTAVVSLAQGFELQLKYKLLEPFCGFLRGRGLETWPVGASVGPQVCLMRGGEMDKFLTLERTIRLMELRDAHFEEYCRAHGFSSDRIRAAARVVRRVRNSAVHEGGMSRERALRYRDDWLNPDSGVFAAIVPQLGR